MILKYFEGDVLVMNWVEWIRFINNFVIEVVEVKVMKIGLSWGNLVMSL